MESIITKIEIGFPFYNEEKILPEFLKRLDCVACEIRKKFKIDTNIICINDNSSDSSASIINSFDFKNIEQVKIIQMSTNYGHPAAIKCLIDNSSRDLILLDSDLQDRPEDILDILSEALLNESDVVRVARGKRSEGVLFRIGYIIFKKLYSLGSGNYISTGTFGFYNLKVITSLRAYPERHRFFPGLVSIVGFKQTYIEKDRDIRFAGDSKVGYRKLIKLGINAWFGFGTLPIRLMMFLGLLIVLLSLLAVLIVIGIKIFTNLAISGWASILISVFFMGGVQILMISVLGEYLARIYEETKHRPIYNIAETDVKVMRS